MHCNWAMTGDLRVYKGLEREGIGISAQNSNIVPKFCHAYGEVSLAVGLNIKCTTYRRKCFMQLFYVAHISLNIFLSFCSWKWMEEI